MQRKDGITKELIKTVLLGLGLWLIVGGFAPFFEKMQSLERVTVGIIMILLHIKLSAKKRIKHFFARV